MKRGTIFLVVFVVIVAALIAASQFIGSQPPVEVTIAVSPLAEDWVRSAADAFNEADRRIDNTRRVRVNIAIVEEMDVWVRGGDIEWTAADHPDGWIPALPASIDYATGSGLPFTIAHDSVALTLLVWGGYADRVETLTGSDPLTWSAVQNAASTESWSALGGPDAWGFVNLAFALPDSTVGGFSVLLSGMAAFNETPTLNAATNSAAFRDWMEPIVESVPNYNTIGTNVARFVARGPSSADMGIAPESQWVTNLNALTNGDNFSFSYPTFPLLFTFPLAAWNGPETADDARAAVTAFGDWLLEAEQQTSVTAFGLRPVGGSVGADADLFAAAEPFGIALTPVMPDESGIAAPSSNDANSLIQWFGTARR